MIRNYNISKFDIYKLRRLLVSKLKSCSDADEIEDINNDIIRIDFLLNRVNKNFNTSNSHNNDDNIELTGLRNDIRFLEDFKYLYKIVKCFIKTGIGVEKPAEVKFRKTHLSNDDAINLAHDFFEEQDEFYYKGFEHFYQNIYGHLKFIKPTKDTDGEIHCIDTTGDFFMYIPNHQDFTKASILIHEIEHAIDFYNNPFFYRNLLIRETSSMFMEMIGVDYLAKELNLVNVNYIRRFYLHTVAKMQGCDIFVKNQVLHLLDKYKNLSDKELLIMFKKYGFSTDLIEFFNSSNIVEDYYYQIPQLIAIELYKIYSEDKEKSLYILKDIIMNGTDENIFEILDKYNIHILEHVVDYEYDLVLKLGI